MRAGDVVVVEPRSTIYYLKTSAEIQARQAEDEAKGRFFDDGGEPLLYSKIGYINIDTATVATVTRMRGLQWPHWTRRPKGLIECFINVDGVPRLVMLKKCDVVATNDVPSLP